MSHRPSRISGTFRLLASLLAVLIWLGANPALANNIAAKLVVEGPVAPGQTVTVAIAMDPAPTWHGYWSNPGDAGFGMTLDWSLPDGFVAGEPEYPVPEPLLIGPLMNHVYDGPYAILVPVSVPADATPGTSVPIGLKADWLACTNEICVPERGEFETHLTIASPGDARAENADFVQLRAALPAPVHEKGFYAIENERLRMALPIANGAALDNPHLFVGRDDMIEYAAAQRFSRSGDWLIVEADAADAAKALDPLETVLRLGDAHGLAITLEPGEVPAAGTPLRSGDSGSAGGGLLWLAFAAFLGGIILNVMPCVFPILSLKAITLARANGEGARAEALAYTGGVLIAVLALSAVMLGLRAAGQEVGWAFQLQEPATIVLLLALTIAITANLAGVFEMTLPVGIGRHGGGAFMTGMLAAFVATPCTGPFMAAAMGAALLLPPLQAMVLFGALGLGLAFPFLLIGFVPLVRKALPAPGPWMVRFRHAMAVPMALTALALAWLAWRLGGQVLLGIGIVAALVVMALLVFAGRRQRRGKAIAVPVLAMVVAVLGFAAISSAMELQAPARADSGEIDAIAFDAEALAQARASGRPVFAYFTADWCVTCKVNEATAIERDATREAFEKAGVVVLRGDWTRRDPTITRYLEAQGAAGVPLYVWYDPGSEGEQLPQVLTASLLVDRAQGH